MEVLKKLFGFVLFAIIKVLLIPTYFGRPGYFLFGCVSMVVANILALILAVVDRELPRFYFPEKDVIDTLVYDGETIARYFK